MYPLLWLSPVIHLPSTMALSRACSHKITCADSDAAVTRVKTGFLDCLFTTALLYLLVVALFVYTRCYIRASTVTIDFQMMLKILKSVCSFHSLLSINFVKNGYVCLDNPFLNSFNHICVAHQPSLKARKVQLKMGCLCYGATTATIWDANSSLVLVSRRKDRLAEICREDLQRESV